MITRDQIETYYIPTGDWPLKIEPYLRLMEKLELERADYDCADVLLLPGGADLGMRHNRDLIEFRAYEEWTFAKKPVLGICRGMQIMLSLTDMALIADIPSVTDTLVHTTQEGNWKGNSSWHETHLGLMTNSRHHQGFFVKEIDIWEPVDWTEDGILEAVSYGNQFAVQWHPEHDDMEGTEALQWWLDQARRIINN